MIGQWSKCANCCFGYDDKTYMIGMTSLPKYVVVIATEGKGYVTEGRMYKVCFENRCSRLNRFFFFFFVLPGKVPGVRTCLANPERKG